MEHIWNIKRLLLPKWRKYDEIATGYFSKMTATARGEPPRKVVNSELSKGIHSTSNAGYVTAVLTIVRIELRAWEWAISVIFDKWPLAISPYFIIFWMKQT